MSDMIKERDLGVYHYLTASLLGGLADLGLLNQGSANLVGRRTGERLADFLVSEGITPTGNPENDLKIIMEKIGIAKEFQVVEEDDKLAVEIPAPLCRYCPKGVGGAEIPGTACPLPGMFEAFLAVYGDGDWKLEAYEGRPLVKEDDNCKIRYVRK